LPDITGRLGAFSGLRSTDFPGWMAYILLLIGATGGPMSVDMQSLYKHVAWCVWHEGLRLYDNGAPGQLKEVSFLRSSCLKLLAHHGAAGALISAASDNELTAVMSQIESRVDREHNLSGHVRWVAYHAARHAELQNLLSEGKHNEIRSIYYRHLNHNSNARYLLSCVSHGYLTVLIKGL